MKTLFSLLATCFSLLALAQSPVEVTIIGTTHAFQQEYQDKQDFSKVRDFIIELNPDIICIEAIPTTDTISLKEIWPKNMKRADNLREEMMKKGSLPRRHMILPMSACEFRVPLIMQTTIFGMPTTNGFGYC